MEKKFNGNDYVYIFETDKKTIIRSFFIKDAKIIAKRNKKMISKKIKEFNNIKKEFENLPLEIYYFINDKKIYFYGIKVNDRIVEVDMLTEIFSNNSLDFAKVVYEGRYDFDYIYSLKKNRQKKYFIRKRNEIVND